MPLVGRKIISVAIHERFDNFGGLSNIASPFLFEALKYYYSTVNNK